MFILLSAMPKFKETKTDQKNLCSLLYAKTRRCRKLRKLTAQKKRILAPFEFYYSKISQGRGVTYLAFFLCVPNVKVYMYKELCTYLFNAGNIIDINHNYTPLV